MILPIFAGLERIPSLAARGVGRPGRSRLGDVPAGHPAAVDPGRRGRLDLHVLADPRRLHRPGLVSTTQFIGNVIFINVAQDLPLAAAYSLVPLAIMLLYLFVVAASRRLRGPLMPTGLGRIALRIATGARPRLHLRPAARWSSIYAFNASGTSAWPPSGFTLEWVATAARQHRAPAGVPDLDRRRPRCDRHRPGAGQPGLAGGRPLLASSAGRRSRSSSSCRSRCPAS